MFKHSETVQIPDASERLKGAVWTHPFSVKGLENVQFSIKTHSNAKERQKRPGFFLHIDNVPGKRSLIEAVKAKCEFQAGEDTDLAKMNSTLALDGTGYGPHATWLTWNDLDGDTTDSAGCLTLQLEMTITEVIYKKTGLVEDYIRALEEGRGDVTVLTNCARDFKVHSQVLAIRSPVFAKMFEGPFSEKSSKQVDMKAYSGKLAAAFINYLYVEDSSVFSTPSLGDAIELFRIADYYQVPRLQQEALDRILSKASVYVKTPETLRTMLDFAKSIRLEHAAFEVRLREALHDFSTELFHYAMQT